MYYDHFCLVCSFFRVCSVVHEVLQGKSTEMLRVQSTALECLRESTEHYLIELFEDAQLTCLHRRRVTVHPVDTMLVQLLRGKTDPGRRS